MGTGSSEQLAGRAAPVILAAGFTIINKINAARSCGPAARNDALPIVRSDQGAKALPLRLLP
jgi:hypothetical protein